METINSIFESREEQAFVESEQIRAYFKEANDQNLAGALVVSLFAYVLHNLSPVWAWLPGLLCLYAVTAVRTWQMRRYRIAPGSRSSRAWGRGQRIAGALSGLCWGYTNTALLAHAPLEYQFFILTVITVSAAASASEGYSFTPPSEYYIVLSLSPPTLWLFTMGDQLHIVLAAMMLVFLPMTIVQGRKRNQVFIEAQTLRFRNESLARKLKEQRDLAHEASVAKARILAAASHDLRQPIHAITLFLDALDNSRSDADRSRLVVSIRSALTALRELLDTLLDLSKLDAGVVKPNPDIVSVDSLFVEIDNAFSPLALKSGLRFMLWMPRTPLTLRTDRRLLLSVLNNVISNALKNTRRGGRPDRAAPQCGRPGVRDLGYGERHFGGTHRAHIRRVLPGGQPASRSFQGNGAGACDRTPDFQPSRIAAFLPVQTGKRLGIPDSHPLQPGRP